MNILCIDTFGMGLDWLLRCKVAGHQVKWYYKPVAENVSLKVGDGFGIEKVVAWKPYMLWADLIVITGNTNEIIAALEPYWKKKFPIFGPNQAATDLEKDRSLGLGLLDKHGIDVVPYETFSDLGKAEEYILKNKDTLYVVKPSGDTGVDRAMSHVSKSVNDLIYTLRDWKKKGCLPKEFLLQEKIKGIEVGVGGWFGENGWSRWWEENFEFKPLMPGDIGPNCDEQGTVMQYTKTSKLADKLLKPLTSYLHEINFRGNIDINCIVDKKGTPWPLEFTCRLGDPAWCIQQKIHQGDPAEWMGDLLEGRDTLKAAEQLAVGVVYTQPDYPFHQTPVKELEGTPLYKLDTVWKDVHPKDLMIGDYPEVKNGKVVTRKGYVSAGCSLLVVSHLADTIAEGNEKCLETIKQIEFPNSPMYRNDIGAALEEELPELQKFGYVKGMQYD
jgi:phosphoribosylamine--glycine ligase